MAAQQLPRTAQPPPELPDLPESNLLAQYLRTFSLWCRHGFADKLSVSSATPQITLQTADTPPNVYQMEVTSKPTITLKRVALGSGDLGPPIDMTISSDLSGYLKLTGGTLTGPLTGTTATFTGMTLTGTLTGTSITLTGAFAGTSITLTGAFVGTTAVFSSTVQAANFVAQAPAGAWAGLNMIAAAGQGKQIAMYSGDTAHPRWTIASNGVAESGSNAGSDFSIARFNDAGAWLDSPLFISRASGNVAFADGISFVNAIMPVNDLTKHINLYGGTFGFNITTNTLNIVANGGSYLQVGSSQVNVNTVLLGNNTWQSSGAIVSTNSISARSNGTAIMTLATASSGATRAQWYQSTDNQLVLQNALATSTPYLLIGNGGGNAMMSSCANSYKPGGGAWLDSSDERIKTVEGDYIVGLEEVLQLRPVVYRFKGNDTTTEDIHRAVGNHDAEVRAVESAPYPASPHYNDAVAGTQFVGFIAQEAEFFPGLVNQREGYIDGKLVTDLRDVDTTPLIYALVNSIKELTARVQSLEAAR